jgi:hypothetical protein
VRKTYELTRETIAVINGNAGAVAKTFGCDPSYISQIMNGTVTDPFAPFKTLYAACVDAGCDVSHWRNQLDTIDRGKASGCVDKEKVDFVEASNEVELSIIKNEPVELQIVKAQKTGRELNEFLDALHSKKQPDVRKQAQELIKRRRAA